MTTENVRLEGRSGTGTQSRVRWPWYAVGAVGIVLAAWVLSHGLTGVTGTRVANPAAPRHVAPLSWGGLSVDPFWIPVFSAVTLAVMALMVWQFVKHYRATGRHHAVLP